jgi:hypothetical protein
MSILDPPYKSLACDYGLHDDCCDKDCQCEHHFLVDKDEDEDEVGEEPDFVKEEGIPELTDEDYEFHRHVFEEHNQLYYREED